jgi:hypothetical protein
LYYYILVVSNCQALVIKFFISCMGLFHGSVRGGLTYFSLCAIFNHDGCVSYKFVVIVPAVYDVWAGIKGLCAASLPQEARPPAQMCRNETWEAQP